MSEDKKRISEGETSSTALPEVLFSVPVNRRALSEAVATARNNERIAVAHAKGRGEVRGGGKKPWRQKGTGRARHGSIRSPIWKGGGATHGPRKERKYQGKINEKEKARALAMALSAKHAAGEIAVVEALSPESFRTKAVVKLLDSLGEKRRSVLLVTAESLSENLLRGSGNIKGVSALAARELSFMDVLSRKSVVLEKKAVEVLKARVA
jgi:large subunit ribosomal protein L4